MEGGNNLVKVADMLREAANLLTSTTTTSESSSSTILSGLSSTTTSSSTSTSSSSTTSSAQANNQVQTGHQNTTTTSNRALANFRTLFQSYNNSSPSRARNQSNSRRSNTSFQPRETWTHDFLCLSKTNVCKVPTKTEKFALLAADLGRKKVVFNSKDDAKAVKLTLEKIFPKLKDGGGFELLRSGAKPGELFLIKPPAAVGYSVPFLRESAGLGQAIVYIRPLQKDLDDTEWSPAVLGSGEVRKVNKIIKSKVLRFLTFYLASWIYKYNLYT